MTPRLIFMGTPEFAVPVLQALIDSGQAPQAVVCQPDRPQGRRMQLVPPPTKILAAQQGLLVLQPESARDPEFYQQLQDLAPEVIVTVAYGQILPQQILDLPPRGCLNLHASLLPKFRGAAPIQAAIRQGETETGVTLMLMDAGMDTGPIIETARLTIGARSDAGSLGTQLSACAAELLLSALPRWLSGELETVPQPAEGVSYARKLDRQAGLIDWQLSALEVDRLIRSVTPWPGAWTWLAGKPFIIHAALPATDPLPSDLADLPPGTLIAARTRLQVVCGEGRLELLLVQPASGKRLKVTEVAHNFRTGQQFVLAPDKE